MVIGILVALSDKYDKKADGDVYSICSRWMTECEKTFEGRDT